VNILKIRSGPERVRVVVADEHPLIRLGFVKLFEGSDGFELVSQCDNADAAVMSISQHRPHVGLIGLRLRPTSGVQVVRSLRLIGDATPVIITAGRITDDEVLEVMRAGAKGVVLKELPLDLLLASIRKVAAGGTWLEKAAVGRTLERILQHEELREKARETLTHREVEIVRMVASGLVNREIGVRLCITEGTVKSHLHTIYDKLGVRGRVNLSSYVRDSGLI
jgi:DNA-binding NarL/FixJ family response regulator